MGVTINGAAVAPKAAQQVQVPAAAPSGTVSWLKKGAASAAVAQKEEQEIKRRKEEQGLMYRFFLKPGEDAAITFVDGDLQGGLLLPPRFYEHNLHLNGSFGNLFVCPEKTNPEAGDKCPICEDPTERPALVALFTIIDHRQFTGKNNKLYVNQRRLFTATVGTFEVLNKYAAKLGGLAGQTFEVSRSKGDKTPRVGDVFIPVKKTPIAELQALYQEEMKDPKTNKMIKTTYFLPAVYEEEIIYRTGDELRKLGLGKPSGITQSQGYAPTGEGSKEDYAQHM